MKQEETRVSLGILRETGEVQWVAGVVTPSDLAYKVARAVQTAPSVRDVRWTADRAGEHLWVRVASWSDDDFFPVVRAHDQADPEGAIRFHVYAVGDKTSHGDSAAAPAGARILVCP